MNLFGMIDQSGEAMQAERMRAEVVAANMANAETTRTPAGTPYHRQHVVFASGAGQVQSLGQNFAPSFAGQLSSQIAAQITGAASSLSQDPANTSLPVQLEAPAASFGPFAEVASAAPGVHIAAVVEDTAPPLKRYDPSHPDADAEGYVSYPDINPLNEMVDLMGATRAYGLNASAVQAEKSMISSALELAK